MSEANGHIASLEDIAALKDSPIVEYAVKAWGDKMIYLKPMSGRNRAKHQTRTRKEMAEENFDDLFIRACAYSMCDADGNLLFKEGGIEKAREVLGSKNGEALEEIATESSRISGLGADEETEKNSPAIQT